MTAFTPSTPSTQRADRQLYSTAEVSCSGAPTHTQTHTHTHADTTQTYSNTHTCTCVNIHRRKTTNTYSKTHTLTCMHKQTQTDTHKHTHTHTYTYTELRGSTHTKVGRRTGWRVVGEACDPRGDHPVLARVPPGAARLLEALGAPPVAPPPPPPALVGGAEGG